MNLPTLVPIVLTLFLLFFLFLFACALVLAWHAVTGGGREGKEASVRSAPPPSRAVVITPGGRRSGGYRQENQRLNRVSERPALPLLTDWRWSNRPDDPTYPL